MWSVGPTGTGKVSLGVWDEQPGSGSGGSQIFSAKNWGAGVKFGVGCNGCSNMRVAVGPDGGARRCALSRAAALWSAGAGRRCRDGGGDLPGALLQDACRIVRFVGHGGMSEVYEASHARFRGATPVAPKGRPERVRPSTTRAGRVA